MSHKPPTLHPNRYFKEVCNGGGARYSKAKWDSQNRANREPRKQLRGAAKVLVGFYFAVKKKSCNNQQRHLPATPE